MMCYVENFNFCPKEVKGSVIMEGNPIYSLENFKTTFQGYLYLSTFHYRFVPEFKHLYEEKRTKENAYNGHHLEISESDLRSVLLMDKLDTTLPDKPVTKKIKL